MGRCNLGRRALAIARMRAADLPPPQVLVSAEDVLEGKPSPEGYVKAADALGRARQSAWSSRMRGQASWRPGGPACE